MHATDPSTHVKVRLAGAPNFRDMGGLRSVDGRRLRSGRLFRSGELSRLTDSDVSLLRKLQIRTVLDLRSQGEQQHWPSRWPDDTATERLDAHIDVDLRSGHAPLRQILEEDLSEAGARRLLMETYRRLPYALTATLIQTVERIAADGLPLLIHCTAGKDRTGFACACFLEAIGIARQDIIADYLQTNRYIDLNSMADTTGQVLERMLGLRANRATLDIINGVHQDYLDIAFETVVSEYGSMDAYLAQLGLDDSCRSHLRDLLLEA
ncbi:MAG: tyrosine-protein phosphatase [Pseudoxanthomonas sp.]